MVWYFLLWALQLHANALLDSSSAKPSVSPVTNQGRMHTHAHSKRVWIPESVSCVHCLCAVSLHLLTTSSRNTVSLYSATSFLIEIFGKWVVGLQRQAAVALEASDFPELSGCLATSCSDHKSRLLLESTAQCHGHGRPCALRDITIQCRPECRCLPSTSPIRELCNCNWPPREVA